MDAIQVLRNNATFCMETDLSLAHAKPTRASSSPGATQAGSSSEFEPYAVFRRTKLFPSLDGLRALSIVSVIGFHVMHGHSALFSHGFLGVQLFFAISGVLITTLLLRERDSAGEISLRNFYVRRTLRIFPLYYAVLGIYVVVTAMFEKGTLRGETFFANLPAYATYTSNWFVSLTAGTGTIFYFAWSLATEEQFYVVWPSIVRFTRHWTIPVIVISVLMISGEFVRYASNAGLVAHDILWARILRSIVPPICLGCLAAFLMHHRRGFTILYRVAGQTWSVPSACVLMIVAIKTNCPSLLIDLSMTLLVVTTMVRPQHYLRWLLDNRVVRHVGAVSYGMYLMHMLSYQITMRLLGKTVNEWLVLLAALALTVTAATLSYYLFERRFLALKKRFERRAHVG
jgi:peptidoglycan/LPS O-acetylase OafA/YrhL